MPENAHLKVLLICDHQFDRQALQEQVLLSRHRIELSVEPLNEDVDALAMDTADVVLLDMSGLLELSISPTDLADTLYCHAPVVLVGNARDSSLALEALQAGAQDWIIVNRLAERPFVEVLKQARLDYWRQRDLTISQARYQSVVEDQSEFICRFLPDADFTITFVNQAYANYLRQAVSNLEGTSLLALMDTPNHLVFKQQIDSLYANSPNVTYDRKIIVDNDNFWVQWTDKGIFDSDGVLLEVQSVGVDVTVRRCAEQRALDSELRFQSFFQDLPIMMQELDAKGRTINVNRCWSETLGYSADDTIGQSFYGFIHQTNRKDVYSACKTIVHQRWIKDLPCTMIKHNGDACNVLLSATAEFDDNDEIQRFLVVGLSAGQDIYSQNQSRSARKTVGDPVS